jgi:hypothetical protein
MRTDRHDKANKRFSQICERPYTQFMKLLVFSGSSAQTSPARGAPPLSSKHHETFIFMTSLGLGTIQQKENVTLRYGPGWTGNFHVNRLGGKREIH